MANNIRTYRGVAPRLGAKVYVDETAVLVGDIEIGDDSSIWPLVAARGDVNTIRIGKNTNIQDGTVLHVTRKSKSAPEGSPLIIGDNVTVGHKTMLHGCRVGNNILIGMGAIVMDDAVVGDNIIIAAGSLVPPGKTLEAGYLYVGNPAKARRKLTEAEISFLQLSADNYAILKDEYLEEVKTES